MGKQIIQIFLRANNHQKTYLAMVMWHCEVTDGTIFLYIFEIQSTKIYVFVVSI